MTDFTRGEASRALATAVAFLVASRARRCSVFMPRWASQQSKGEGTAPIAFWRKVSRSLSSGELKAATPMRTS